MLPVSSCKDHRNIIKIHGYNEFECLDIEKYRQLICRECSCTVVMWPLNSPQIAKFMGPTWGPPGSCRPKMGPMFVPWTVLSGWKHVYLLKLIHVSVCRIYAGPELGRHRVYRWPSTVRYQTICKHGADHTDLAKFYSTRLLSVIDVECTYAYYHSDTFHVVTMSCHLFYKLTTLDWKHNDSFTCSILNLLPIIDDRGRCNVRPGCRESIYYFPGNHWWRGDISQDTAFNLYQWEHHYSLLL